MARAWAASPGPLTLLLEACRRLRQRCEAAETTQDERATELHSSAPCRATGPGGGAASAEPAAGAAAHCGDAYVALQDREHSLELNCASGKEEPDMRGRVAAKHRCVVFDEAHAAMVVQNKKLLQCPPCPVQMGSSSTNIYSYSVYVHACLFVVCSDTGQSAVKDFPQEEREWLVANIVYVHVEAPLRWSRSECRQLAVRPSLPPAQPRPVGVAAAESHETLGRHSWVFPAVGSCAEHACGCEVNRGVRARAWSEGHVEAGKRPEPAPGHRSWVFPAVGSWAEHM